MNNTTRIGDEIRFAVIASAMTPRGAWAKSLGGTNDETAARRQFALAGFTGPEAGIVWGHELSLVRVVTTRRAPGDYATERTTLETRRA
jgi:hypothetical protein